MDTYKLKIKVAEAFTRYGWKPCDEISLRMFSGISKKAFDTAVGTKESVIYLEPSSEGGMNLKADYRSEGNNVLSSLVENIPHDVEDAELSKIVAKFNASISDAVSKTYAARLLAAGHSVWNPALA